MAKRRGLIVSLGLIVVIFVAVLGWQLPTLLKAIPSRYVARLPEAVQAIGEREHVEVLPTAAVTQSDGAALLAEPTRSQPLATSTQPLATNDQLLATSTQPPPTSTPLPTATSVPIAPAGRLANFQHQFQTWNNCGPATLAMSLSYFDIPVTQDDTASYLKPNPEDRNVSPYQLVEYVEQNTDLTALSRTNGDLDTLRRLIAEGIPVIIELGINPPGEYAWLGWYGHYLLVVAYDDASETIWVYDSWFGTSEVPGTNATTEGRAISYDELDLGWREFNRNYVAFARPEQTPTLHEIIGPNLDDTTMWTNALTRMEAELRTETDNAFLWFNMGTIHNALGDYERASAFFDQARSIGLPWRMLWYQFGPYEAYYQSGRYEDVILLADVTLQDRPYFEESYYYRGLAQAALGFPDLAQDSFEKAVNFNPNYLPAGIALQEITSEN